MWFISLLYRILHNGLPWTENKGHYEISIWEENALKPVEVFAFYKDKNK